LNGFPLRASNEGPPSILFQSRMERMRVKDYEFIPWFSHTSGEKSFEATLPKERRSGGSEGEKESWN